MFLNLKQKYMEFVAFLCLHPTFPFKHIKMDSEVALVLLVKIGGAQNQSIVH